MTGYQLVIALLLSIGGLFMRRRIVSGYAAEQAAAVRAPVIGEKA